jgi:hypothetical protein
VRYSRRVMPSLRRAAFALVLSLFACSGGSTTPGKDAGTAGGAGHGGGSNDAGPTGWKPDDVEPSIRDAAPRGFLDLRGLIHAHSVYSHDACDGEPRDPVTDAINQPCFDDFRRDLCKVGHDFVMLTDHNESFGRSEYPDTLLYRADRGDQLVTRAGGPVANWAACEGGGAAPLILGGTESGTIAAGLEGHVQGTIEERQGIYGDASAASIDAMKAQGAVSILMHTEDWTVDQITTLPVDGFEMYNLHANLKNQYAEALELLFHVNTPEDLPHPDLVVLPIFEEDPVYLSTWGSVLASGARRVTTMATDCHRNSLQQKLQDGERVDSYRRMMKWFSNHLLVKPDAEGKWDDRSLKDALRAGRLYGAFEVFGYPIGFDYHAVVSGAVHEMGEDVSLAGAPELSVALPKIARLDASAEAPRLTIRILRAKAGGWDVVAEGEEDVTFSPKEKGAYRAEVRIVPRHLRGYLSTYSALADKDYPWIYTNAIYVVE